MAVLLLHYGYVVATAMAAVSARREIVLWLPWQSGENKRVCSSYSSLNLLPASDLPLCLPWVQRTVCTVKYSKTIGTVNRISDTIGVVSRTKRHTFGFLTFSLILAVSHFISSCCFITLPFSSSCSLSLSSSATQSSPTEYASVAFPQLFYY